MGLLQSLGLPEPTAPNPGALAGHTEEDDSPSRSDGPRPSDARQKRRAAAPSITELAQWPSKAHRAWKRLDQAQQKAVAEQMASRYGQAFADAFVAAAKSGKTKLEGADFVTAQASQTPDAMKAAGYKLAQFASNGDRAQEWWVRPDGFEVFLLRVVGPDTPPQIPPQTPQRPPETPRTEPPVEPPRTCSKESLEQLEMALEWRTRALAEAKEEKEQIEAEKARMGKLNVTSKDFEQAYNAMTERLKDDIAHLESVIEDINTTKTSLKDSGCALSKLDTAIDELTEELTGFEVEKSMHEMDIRKPLKVDVKDIPDDDE